jgi:MFS family permease
MGIISIKNKINIAFLSFLHLLCDLICGYKIIGVLAINFYDYGLYIFILYNSLAFCFQPLAGIFVDRYHKEKILLIVSFVLLALGLFINPWLLSAIFLGIGNQFFHIAGGKICANISTEKSSHLGVFVSLGAIGLAIGGNLYYYRFIPYLALGLYLVFTIVCFFTVDGYALKELRERSKFISKKEIILSVLFLLFAVFIRSYLGKIIHYDFRINLGLLLLLPAAAALGKFLGGFIRDRFGSFFTVLFSMALASILLIFFDHSIVLMMLGLLMINISMPITLYELNRLLPGKEGFNFGIIAGILFPGFVIGMLYEYSQFTYIIVVTLSSALAILSMYYIKRRGLHG